uniref:Uncharacterized protein n=1 Tax=Arundo donax TaxID=35708 RepID=A0A0A9EBY1_ARUDO
MLFFCQYFFESDCTIVSYFIFQGCDKLWTYGHFHLV